MVAVKIERLCSNGIGPAAIYPAAVVATTNDVNFNFPNSLQAFMYCIIPGAVLPVKRFDETDDDGNFDGSCLPSSICSCMEGTVAVIGRLVSSDVG